MLSIDYIETLRRIKQVVILSTLLSVSFGNNACAMNDIVACAIRWDAWYTNGVNDIGHYTATALGKPEWRARTPLHATIDGSGRITWTPSQQTFDAEIRAVKQANLCWAFLTYGANHEVDLKHPLMRGLAYLRSSAIKAKAPYALILQGRTLGQTNNFRAAVAKILSLMHDDNYERIVIAGQVRPLLLFFYEADGVNASFGGSIANLRGPFDLIRESAREQGLGEPYVVVLAWSGAQAEAIRESIGADANSEYFSGHWNGHVMPGEFRKDRRGRLGSFWLSGAVGLRPHAEHRGGCPRHVPDAGVF